MINKNLCTFTSGTNSIHYELVHTDTVAASSYEADDKLEHDQLSLIIGQFIDELRHSYDDAETLVVHPGAYNPKFARAMYQAVRTAGSDYKLIYNLEIVTDEPSLDEMLQQVCSQTSWDCTADKRHGQFSFMLALKKHKKVQTPYRWYVLDPDGYAILECIDKPDAPRLYQSLRLREKFQKYRIQITDRLRVRLRPK